jgi:hypothetical protein
MLLDIKGHMGPDIIIAGELKTTYSVTDRFQTKSKTKQKTQRNIRVKLHCRSNELNRHLQSILLKSCGIKFFSTAHGIFSKIDHIIGHKAHLNKNKEIKKMLYFNKS